MSNPNDFVIEDGVLKKYVGPGGKVVIPEEVTDIGSGAFNNCLSVTSVTLPKNLKTIAGNAFKGCRGLADKDGFVKTKKTLFEYFGPDGEVAVPEGIINISGSAFFRKEQLTSITLPDSVKNIQPTAFKGCKGLADSAGFVIVRETLFDYIGPGGDVVIPDGVTCISPVAFASQPNVKSVCIPEGVTSIGNSAFKGCSNLTNITIPDSVTSIGDRAFEDCSNLRSVTIPGSVTSIGNRAFTGCSNLTSVTIPEGVKSIGDSAFYGCSNLTSITIPDSVTNVGGSAFYNCSSLTSVTIPDGVGSIGNSAFSCCRNLTSVTIPNSVTSIGEFAFSGCDSLTSVTIPAGVTSIGRGAFRDCDSLTSVAIPAGVTSIGDSVFYGCRSLTSMTIPEGVTSIGDWTFYDCHRLKRVEISESVTSIGGRAFEDCRSLKNVTIPQRVASIGSSAFSGCRKLADADGFVIVRGVLYNYFGSATSVTIPKGVIRIGEGAFKDCNSLTSVTIPDSVTRIDSSVFWGCSSLASMTIPDSVMNIGDEAFAGCAFQIVLSPMALSNRIADNRSYGLILTGKEPAYRAYSAKADTDNLSVFVSKADWQGYDLELINNGPKFKYSLPARLIGALGRLLDPVELTDENRTMLAELLNKNAKKLIPLAEMLGSGEVIRALFSLNVLDDKNVKAVKKILAASAIPEIADLAAVETTTAAKKKQEKAEPTSPLAREYAEKLKAIKGDAQIKKMRLIGTAFPRVLLQDGSEAPEELFRFLLVSYGSQLSGQYHYVSEADAAAALLAYDSLCEALDAVSNHMDVPAYPALLPLLCRYGNAVQIKSLIQSWKSWGAWEKFGQKGRKAQELFKSALALSDTHEAVVWLNKNADLKEYARMRGVREADVYEQYFFNFGFDANGKKTYDLGVTTVEASIDRELKLSLYDTVNKKQIRSIPRKGIDPNIQKKATADLADLRANIKKAAKVKTDQLFNDYLSGKSVPADAWQKNYLSNPLLRTAAELLVWEQDGNCFTLGAAGSIDSAGAPYTITEKPIRLAHPMEMKPEEVVAWQKYYIIHGLKQPFAQVWEAVYERSEIREDRYKSCLINVYYLKSQTRRGIHVEWCDEWELSIQGFDVVTGDEVDADDRVEIVSLRPREWNRRANAVIAFLDRITVFDRLKKDDVSVMNQMSGFTLAQITEFIKIAQENNAINVLALLLDYKNAHFADFDPMDEFTLEW